MLIYEKKILMSIVKLRLLPNKYETMVGNQNYMTKTCCYDCLLLIKKKKPTTHC